MKKFKSAALALALAASLIGCSANSSVPEASKAPEASSAESEEAQPRAAETSETDIPVRIGSLKGPTSIGLVHMMEENSETGSYEFTIVPAADELLASMVSEKLDIALIPANVASVLYQKTEGQISVIDINTLGVLSIISGDSSISSWADLAGKTVYLTGKGTTPDYVLQYLLKERAALDGFSPEDITLEYKSEAAEIAAVLKENPESIGLLPQPFATVAMSQNEALRTVFDLTAEWDKLQTEGGSRLVTGVTVVRNDFLEEHPEAVEEFLMQHEASAKLALEEPDATAALIVKTGIIEKDPVAKKALPSCSIVFIKGNEMKDALSGYLEVLFEQDPKSVGGALPNDDFYYGAE
mgnify:CR=1 FL=1